MISRIDNICSPIRCRGTWASLPEREERRVASRARPLHNARFASSLHSRPFNSLLSFYQTSCPFLPSIPIIVLSRFIRFAMPVRRSLAEPKLVARPSPYSSSVTLFDASDVSPTVKEEETQPVTPRRSARAKKNVVTVSYKEDTDEN